MTASAADVLPLIDVHAISIPATASQTWPAVLDVVHDALSGTSRSVGGHVLGCEPARADVGDELTAGTNLVGFRVAEMRPPHLLLLAGRHRFSRYTLTFELTDTGDRACECRATTHAAFPGIIGTIYRAAVIGSSGHAVLMRRFLRTIAAEAAGSTDSS
ncbi:MAG: hypothetical protein QOG53_345 [Frankiales bacterium]|jgi:hypothetical protein|nr:hypothetical protein [Frankiales bacterium]